EINAIIYCVNQGDSFQFAYFNSEGEFTQIYQLQNFDAGLSSYVLHGKKVYFLKGSQIIGQMMDLNLLQVNQIYQLEQFSYLDSSSYNYVKVQFNVFYRIQTSSYKITQYTSWDNLVLQKNGIQQEGVYVQIWTKNCVGTQIKLLYKQQMHSFDSWGARQVWEIDGLFLVLFTNASVLKSYLMKVEEQKTIFSQDFQERYIEIAKSIESNGIQQKKKNQLKQIINLKKLSGGNCISCHKSCKTCFGAKSDQCQECYENYQIDKNICYQFQLSIESKEFPQSKVESIQKLSQSTSSALVISTSIMNSLQSIGSNSSFGILISSLTIQKLTYLYILNILLPLQIGSVLEILSGMFIIGINQQIKEFYYNSNIKQLEIKIIISLILLVLSILIFQQMYKYLNTQNPGQSELSFQEITKEKILNETIFESKIRRNFILIYLFCEAILIPTCFIQLSDNWKIFMIINYFCDQVNVAEYSSHIDKISYTFLINVQFVQLIQPIYMIIILSVSVYDLIRKRMVSRVLQQQDSQIDVDNFNSLNLTNINQELVNQKNVSLRIVQVFKKSKKSESEYQDQKIKNTQYKID
ncbi:hypothetical protein ABPG73_008086, partial [Tetrahymena malaccensis]